MSRRTARKHIFNIVFQTEFHSDEEIDETVSIYNDNITNIDDNNFQKINNSDKVFIEKEVSGILKNKKIIDEKINECAVDWTIDRIAKVDIAILRLAVYEILFEDDIPKSVSANEAVELAKEFSSDNSPAFINGILGKIINNLDI